MKLLAGVDDWNLWREQFPDAKPALRNAGLSKAKLRGADLSSAALRGANLERAHLFGAQIDYADLTNAVLNEAVLSQATLIETSLRGASLKNSIAIKTSFTRADLTRANLTRADLSGADLEEARLQSAILNNANLFGVDLRGALLTKAQAMDADLSEALLTESDLSAANLKGARLVGAKLDRAVLSGANLAGADLSDADLTGANLQSARLNGACLRRALLHSTVLRRANLEGADLQGAFLINTDCEHANLAYARVYGIAAWDVGLEHAVQTDLVITREDQAEITVDSLDVAQFIYLLLNNSRIRNVIDTLTTKTVLILGRFTTERKRTLDALRKALRDRNYVPIVFDFEKPGNRDYSETVLTLASLSRFVIADLTEPNSIPQELTVIVQQLLSVPVRPLLRGTHSAWKMFDDLARHPQVIAPFHYKDDSTLLNCLNDKVIVPAEQCARKMAGR